MVDLNINSLRDGAANRLNTSCFCTTLNRTQMHTVLQADELNQDVLSSHPQLFSNTSVFISQSQKWPVKIEGFASKHRQWQ